MPSPIRQRSGFESVPVGRSTPPAGAMPTSGSRRSPMFALKKARSERLRRGESSTTASGFCFCRPCPRLRSRTACADATIPAARSIRGCCLRSLITGFRSFTAGRAFRRLRQSATMLSNNTTQQTAAISASICIGDRTREYSRRQCFQSRNAPTSKFVHWIACRRQKGGA